MKNFFIKKRISKTREKLKISLKTHYEIKTCPNLLKN